MATPVAVPVADDRATKDDYSLATTGSATTLKVGADGPFLLMITPKNGKKVHPDAPLEISFADNALLKPANDNAIPYGIRVRIVTAAVAALAGLGGLLLLYFT